MYSAGIGPSCGVLAIADCVDEQVLEVAASEDLAEHVTDTVKPALNTLAEKLAACAWDKPGLASAIKET